MDRLQADLALSRAQLERLQKDLEDTRKTKAAVESLEPGQALRVPLSSKGFLLGQIVEPSKLHVKLGATDLI